MSVILNIARTCQYEAGKFSNIKWPIVTVCQLFLMSYLLTLSAEWSEYREQYISCYFTLAMFITEHQQKNF
jgi:hypothetical protein